MRIHRLLGIIMLLDSRGIVKASHLAKTLETSERTVYRDIDILCEAGIPIVSISGPNGGYSFMEGYEAKLNSLGNGDVVNLLFSSMGIKPEENTDSAYQLKNALIKLEGSVSKENREEIIKAKERFFVDEAPWWRKAVPNKHVEAIKKAVLQLNKLKVHYKKYDGCLSERILRPYGVVIKNAEWYMIAFCEERNELRVFKCSRIEKIEGLDQSFNIPQSFQLEQFWGNTQEEFKRETITKLKRQAYPVKIKCFEEKKNFLEGFEVCECTKGVEVWYYTMDLISFKTASHVIFPLSDEVEVLEPIELVQYITEKTAKIMKLYKIN